MICPKCKEEGRTSRIESNGYLSTTAAYYPPYYDEEGKFHNHDRNRSSSPYYCSNGHHLLRVLANKCGSCDFGQEETLEVVERKA